MFGAAITDQGSLSPTAKSMVENSAQRVLREYRDESQQAGRIVLTLADLYSALEDVNGAGTLLEGFLAEANPDADPAAFADARQKLANIELLRGHEDRADNLLTQADAFWASAPTRHQEERLEVLTVRARVPRNRGELNGAIAATQEAIRQRSALSGRHHRETTILYNSLAISLTAANRLDEALDAYHETTRIYQSLGLGDGLDAQIIVADTGSLEPRIGHLLQAETLLKEGIDRERALDADAALREPVAMREKHPEDVWELAQARERLGEVMANRKLADASAILTKAVQDLESQLGATHPQTLRAKSVLAKLHT
jgi:tetratricopeptide (TPR) repeat protein